MQLCTNELAVYILGLEILFLLISVQCFFCWHVTGAFSCGVPLFAWLLINTMWFVVIKMGAYLHGHKGAFILCECLLSRF